MKLATQKHNPFTQQEIKLKNIITPNRYQIQYLNQYFSMENDKLQQTAPKITHFLNKTKIQQTSNSQKVNDTILKMKITSTKINNSTLISHKKIVETILINQIIFINQISLNPIGTQIKHDIHNNNFLNRKIWHNQIFICNHKTLQYSKLPNQSDAK